ncbi:unnamed protein product [Caenorhabditis bovis]|uniref:Uncharacterized protein n=1 Tax=Caenorhabditis bovis TaxID=2654633 RepID=A0A8S1EG02_9PELO|nr:unnamed protein product [Caenorhabditis bovis]
MLRPLLIAIVLVSTRDAKELAWYSTEPVIGTHPVAQKALKAATAIDFCQLPPDVGKCSQKLVRYYYDPVVDECKRFTFTGCGGNSNRFMRRAHCRNRCVKRPNRESELKHRRTLRTTTTQGTTTTTMETTTTTRRAPETMPVRKMNLVKSVHENGLCNDCDPLFGTCIDGVCGCMKGFRSLGKVCIDLNECDNGAICGPNSRCVNTVGSYTCECDSGFQIDGTCKIGPEACQDEFDINLTEEDCNNGRQEIRYYYDSLTASCKQFFYGGCRTKSRNFFADLQTCDILCAAQQRNYLEAKDPSSSVNLYKRNHYKIDLLSSPSSYVQPERPLSVDDWPLRPATIKPKLDLDFSEIKDVSHDLQKKEAADALKIVNEITPNHDPCLQKFDAVLREECISAEWVERFFWNDEFKECEAFWYDTSCDPRNTAAKNFFDNFESCHSKCVAKTEKLEATSSTTQTPMVPTSMVPSQETFEFFKIDTSSTNYLEDIEATTTFNPNHLSISTTTQKSVPLPTTTCSMEFDSDLRNECVSAEWDERFYWNSDLKECEAFWYDKSCGDLDYESKNVFATSTSCEEACVESSATPALPSPPTTPKVERPNYDPRNPLNLILNEAIKPNKESMLPDKLPSKYESNFAAKEPTATTKFDRLKYMAEFKKKLMELPSGFTTLPTGSTPTTTATVSSTSPQSTTTSFDDFVEAEKRKVEETLKQIDKPSDFCDEPLHPKLEEDCAGDQWEIKWFFNPDRGACKSFWYGGCVVETQNFFPNHAVCRAICAHKYAAENGFAQKIMIAAIPTTLAPRFDRLTTSLKLIYPHSEDLFPSELPPHYEALVLDNNLREVRPPITKGLVKVVAPSSTEKPPVNIVNVSKGPQKSEEPSFFSHVDRVFTDIKTGEHPGFAKPEEFVHRIQSSSNDFVRYDINDVEVARIIEKEAPTTTTEKSTHATRSINDPCDDEYDPKWDEDCLGDQWVVRSYYDKKAEACKAFWYGGCQTSSRNIWFDKTTCKTACAHKFATPLPSAHASTSSDASTEPSTTPQTVIFVPDAARVVSAGGFSNPFILKIKAHVVEFEADLNRKLADVKRERESRADLKYSTLVDHPVTIADDCLDAFNESLAAVCGDGKVWKNRYYYDKDTRMCRMFWSNECFGTSKNNFDDLETCQWKCEGRHPQPAGKSCLEAFDEKYLEDCRHGEFTSRFYFDHDRKKCVAFHWGGCQAKSANFFTDMRRCQELCESPPRELTQACVQPFDESYTKSCSNSRPQQYYYFDMHSGICKLFWFGNCKGENQNIFSTLESCQWICERKREERAPAMCADKFDPKYTESCSDGKWIEKWYFDQSSGDCVSFWWDGCTSPSQNIFPDEKSCTSNCQHPGFEISSQLATDDGSQYRCLEPVEIGSCQDTYPAFYYDRTTKECRAFAYSGCGGNSNRFMTMSQCQTACYVFNTMNEAEMDCHLPMHIGYGKNDENCLPQAGFRFYYDRNYGKCSQMWYLGCGGNANNFYSYETCQRTCQPLKTPAIERKPRASREVCYEAPGDRGTCATNSSVVALQRWTYTASSARCSQFTYSGCGGNRNRFATEHICQQTCKGMKPSADPRFCSFPPSTGSCNQLRYQWFYNQTRGTCDQFLYGGCDGNANRFETFDVCQKTCEPTGADPCFESLDRGSWCEAMSNRYYYNKRAKQCKGFHYTGCGKSNNNFLTKEECQSKCEKRYPRSALPGLVIPKKKSKSKIPIGYSGTKPVAKTPMIRHVNLNGLNATYHKSEFEWMDYNFCYGYRYNVSGRDTILNVHLCSMERSTECITEKYRTTDGEEFCNLFRPFLRGVHLYSWFFGLDTMEPPYILNDGKSGRIQRKNETLAAIMLLKANNCYEIC